MTAIQLPIGALAGPDLETEITDQLLIEQGDALLAALETDRERKEVEFVI